MFRSTSSTLLLATLLLAAGCQRSVRIPHGPRLLLPTSLHTKVEGDVLRVGSGDLSNEQCNLTLEARVERSPILALEHRFAPEGATLPLPVSHQDDLWRMELPPGNTRHVVLARIFGPQTILLTFCPDDPTQNESELKNIFLHDLEP